MNFKLSGWLLVFVFLIFAFATSSYWLPTVGVDNLPDWWENVSSWGGMALAGLYILYILVRRIMDGSLFR